MYLRLNNRKHKGRRPVLSLSDLAELTTVDESWLARCIKKSHLEVVFIGKKGAMNKDTRHFYRSELIEWADKNGWLK